MNLTPIITELRDGVDYSKEIIKRILLNENINKLNGSILIVSIIEKIYLIE